MAKDWHQKQKDRGVKLIISWFAPRKCCKKYRNGKTKYFHHPNSAAGYEAAVAEYHAWIQEERDCRTFAAEYGHHIEQLRKCLEWYGRFGVPDEEDEIQQDRTDEAVIAYILHPELFTKRECLNCKRTFKVSRRNVSCCGRKCREGYLATLGYLGPRQVLPKDDRDEKWVDRVYTGKEPLVVSPEALPIADAILSSQEGSSFQEEAVDATEQFSDSSLAVGGGSDRLDDILNDLTHFIAN
jgi:hypothetical protein